MRLTRGGRRRLRIALVLGAPLLALVLASERGVSQAAQAAPLSPFASAKARALLRDRLPCLGCHELDGEGGRIGPSLTGVRQRRSAAYIARMIDDPQGTVPGTVMPKTPMTAALRGLIVAYLSGAARDTADVSVAGDVGVASHTSGGPPPKDKVPPRAASALINPAPPASSPRPAPELYAHFCAPCHGATGRGDGPNARFLPVRPAVHADRAAMGARTDDRLYDAIAAGGYPLGRSSRMPAFGETLSRAEIRGLVGYIRRLCKCEGPAWSRDGAPPAPSR